MGNGLSKRAKRKKNELTFYETSDEQWVFREKHLNAIKESLQMIQLQMMQDLILEYLGNTKISKWNHPNYTTFVHMNGTPLADDLSPISQSNPRRLLEYKVVVLGMTGVGKSALTIRLVTNEFLDEYDPTIEDSYRKTFTVNVLKELYDEDPVHQDDAQQIILDILDTAVPEEFSSMYDGWARYSQIHILVFSVVDKESFEGIEPLREKIVRYKQNMSDVRYPIIVVGNKCDLRMDAEYNDSSVDMDVVFKYCKDNKLPYIETSAKEGKNVNLLFRHSVYEHRCIRGFI